MQIGFLNAHSEKIVVPISHLVDGCTSRGVPNVFTEFHNPPGSPYERLIGWTDLRDTQETALHDTLIHRADRRIKKSVYSALTPEFLALAEEYGWSTTVICGVSTESCVLKTAADAFEQGFTPIVVSDAVASDLGDEMHAKGLAIIEVLIGKDQVMTTEELLYRF